MTRHNAELNQTDIGSLGRALRRYREECHYLAKDFATTIGVAPSYLSEIESGKRRLTTQLIGKTALALGKEPDEFTRILQGIHASFTMDLETDSSTTLREEPAQYYPRQNIPTPSNEHRELSVWLVSIMPKPEAWKLLRTLTDSAEAGDPVAARCAKALLEILSEAK